MPPRRRHPRRQQVVDDFHETIVEISLRVAEIDIGILEQGVETPIDFRRRAEIDAGHHIDYRDVTFEIALRDRKVAVVTLAIDEELATDAFQRADPLCHVRPGKIVDRCDYALDQARLDEHIVDRFANEFVKGQLEILVTPVQ